MCLIILYYIIGFYLVTIIHVMLQFSAMSINLNISAPFINHVYVPMYKAMFVVYKILKGRSTKLLNYQTRNNF